MKNFFLLATFCVLTIFTPLYAQSSNTLDKENHSRIENPKSSVLEKKNRKDDITKVTSDKRNLLISNPTIPTDRIKAKEELKKEKLEVYNKRAKRIKDRIENYQSIGISSSDPEMKKLKEALENIQDKIKDFSK